jgi:hypothetical protein
MVGGDIEQRLQAPNSWIRSKDVNLFKIVCNTLTRLAGMNTQLAAHIH